METSIAEQKKDARARLKNTFLSTSSSKKFKLSSKYRITSSHNSNIYLPPISTSTSDLDFQNNLKKQNIYFPLKSELINNYDHDNLKQRLIDNRMDMNKKSSELTELRIKYYKLLE